MSTTRSPRRSPIAICCRELTDRIGPGRFVVEAQPLARTRRQDIDLRHRRTIGAIDARMQDHG